MTNRGQIGCVTLNFLTSNLVKRKHKFYEIQLDGEWRVSLIRKAVNLKQNAFQFSTDDKFLTNNEFEI